MHKTNTEVKHFQDGTLSNGIVQIVCSPSTDVFAVIDDSGHVGLYNCVLGLLWSTASIPRFRNVKALEVSWRCDGMEFAVAYECSQFAIHKIDRREPLFNRNVLNSPIQQLCWVTIWSEAKYANVKSGFVEQFHSQHDWKNSLPLLAVLLQSGELFLFAHGVIAIGCINVGHKCGYVSRIFSCSTKPRHCEDSKMHCSPILITLTEGQSGGDLLLNTVKFHEEYRDGFLGELTHHILRAQDIIENLNIMIRTTNEIMNEHNTGVLLEMINYVDRMMRIRDLEKVDVTTCLLALLTLGDLQEPLLTFFAESPLSESFYKALNIEMERLFIALRDKVNGLINLGKKAHLYTIRALVMAEATTCKHLVDCLRGLRHHLSILICVFNETIELFYASMRPTLHFFRWLIYHQVRERREPDEISAIISEFSAQDCHDIHSFITKTFSSENDTFAPCQIFPNTKSNADRKVIDFRTPIPITDDYGIRNLDSSHLAFATYGLIEPESLRDSSFEHLMSHCKRIISYITDRSLPNNERALKNCVDKRYEILEISHNYSTLYFSSGFTSLNFTAVRCNTAATSNKTIKSPTIEFAFDANQILHMGRTLLALSIYNGVGLCVLEGSSSTDCDALLTLYEYEGLIEENDSKLEQRKETSVPNTCSHIIPVPCRNLLILVHKNNQDVTILEIFK
ncbi:hypothetical protein ACOME3_009419 [Neoechinorhynchus agilis]